MTLSPVKISVAQWNVTLQSSHVLSIEESNIKAKEAFLYMTKSDFMSMFVTDSGVDGLEFVEGASSTILDAMRAQSVFFNLDGNSGDTAAPSILDSFIVKAAQSITGDNLPLAEQIFLTNTLEQFGFINAFIAYSKLSRKTSLTEFIGMGQKCVDRILDSLNTELAKKIFSDLSNERTVSNLGEAFIVGDQISFLLTHKPHADNKDFVDQNFRCVIELVADSTTLTSVPYKIVEGGIRLYENIEYENAYTNSQIDFTYTNTDTSTIGTLIESSLSQI